MDSLLFDCGGADLFLSLPDMLFHQGDQPVKAHGKDTEDDNTHYDNVHFEDLASINNQISESFVGSQKFPDNDAHQTETNVDLHVVDDQRDRAWDENFNQNIFFVSSQSVDQTDFIGIYFFKTGVKGHDGTKDRYRNGGYHDRFHIIPQPYDQYRSHGRF